MNTAKTLVTTITVLAISASAAFAEWRVGTCSDGNGFCAKNGSVEIQGDGSRRTAKAIARKMNKLEGQNGILTTIEEAPDTNEL